MSNYCIPHSQAQCQVAQSIAIPKPVIELVCFPTLFADTKKLNLLRQRKQND